MVHVAVSTNWGCFLWVLIGEALPVGIGIQPLILGKSPTYICIYMYIYIGIYACIDMYQGLAKVQIWDPRPLGLPTILTSAHGLRDAGKFECPFSDSECGRTLNTD